MADNHGSEGKQKLMLTESQKKLIDGLDKSYSPYQLVKDLYANVSNDFNVSSDLKKKDADYVLKLAQKIGGYKSALGKVKGVLGYFKYHFGMGYESRMAREMSSYLKKMEGGVKEFLQNLEYGTKEARKAGLKAMKAYAVA